MIPGSLIFSSQSQGRDRRPWIAGAVGLMCIGLFGIAVVPAAAVPVWLLAFGVGSGAALALLLTLPVDLSDTPEGVARLTAWMLGLGYPLCAAAPVLVGLLRDATGGFVVPMALLGLVALACVVVVLRLPPPHSAHDEDRELRAVIPMR